jgi:hypothetical protein
MGTQALHAANRSDTVGYFIGGADPDHVPRCFRLVSKPDRSFDVEPLAIGEYRFDGKPEFYNRVFFGFSAELPEALLTALRVRYPQGLPANFDEQFVESFIQVASPLRVAGFRDLPIREAIDFVHTYIHITIKAFKFRFGPPLCGGPIEVGFVTTDRPFRWACHKRFGTAAFEQESWYERTDP